MDISGAMDKGEFSNIHFAVIRAAYAWFKFMFNPSI
jgi:hypothetical protein